MRLPRQADSTTPISRPNPVRRCRRLSQISGYYVATVTNLLARTHVPLYGITVYSLTNLVSLYHDNILHKAVSSLPAPLRPPSSSHTRYTRHWTTVSPPYRRMAQLLSVIQSLELLLEMTVRKKRGRASAEQLAIALEAIKAALKLGLMGATNGRTSVQPPVAEREMDPTLLEKERDRMIRMRKAAATAATSNAPTPPQSAADVLLRRMDGSQTDAELGLIEGEVEEKEFWTGAKTGLVRPTLASLRQGQDAPGLGDPTSPLSLAGGPGKDLSTEYLSRKVLTIEDVKRPEDLVERAKGVKQLAEVIWILRPLIYGELLPLFWVFRLAHSSELTAFAAFCQSSR